MSSIQFDYSTLSTSISRSELGSIIGQNILDNSYDSYDINEESSSDRTSSNSNEVYVHPPPPDRFSLVYLTFGFLGIGAILPWNFFITANDYWMYKFRSTINTSCNEHHNKTDLQAAFTSYLAISYNVPYVIFLILCTVFNNRLSKIFRVAASLGAIFILFSTVTAFVEIDTDGWQMGFFSVILLIVVAVGVTSALFQAGVAGIVSLLPAKYMHIMVLGQAIAGILASVIQTLSLVGDCDSIKSALIYFFSADTVILITGILFIVMQKSEFFKYHVRSLKESLVFDSTILKDIPESDLRTGISVVHVTKLIWPYALSILFDFWVTIGIFPGLAVLATPKSHESIWTGKLFLPLSCFLLFNFSDFCGRLVGGWLPLPTSKRLHLLTLCTLRVFLFPIIMLCSLHPRYHLPVLMPTEPYYILFMAVLGFSNGYFVAVAMVVGMKSVNPLLQETAGVILSAFLGAGLMLGSLTSYICIKII